ncbi:MAG TPA: pantoate--beta-alanine ligase [Thermoanaerobaculaceae bacterium]|nr:pantoate--beta-alanine ligase [Thermoanaerobaculaceae bacterium]
MLTVTTIAAVRARRAELRREGRSVAFVPTMGALHAGHLALVRRGRELADEVWASVFVNPTQFGPGEDFERYPRDLEADRAALAAEGAALLFAPGVKELYPRPTSTVVDLPALAAGLCGARRPGHFRGVALVVAKLFNIVQPEVAIFGAKDAQQAAVIRRMALDLDFPVRVVVAPTVREPDGLAMSSRNRYLSAAERRAALALSRALRRGAESVRAGERSARAIEAAIAGEIAREELVRLEYAAAADPDTLEPLEVVADRVLLAVAASVGATRLIDNLEVEAR